MPEPIQVLIIEDNEDDAFFETRELRRAGYDPATARVDSEADLRAALVRQSWDLVLCDFTLPGFGGAQALRIAKDLRPEIPFIFVSGTIGEEAVAEAMRSGAQDYVMKDRLNRLVPAVRRELQEAAARRSMREAERSMRESEHKYRQLFDALTEAVFLVEERSGRIIDTNRVAEHLLRHDRASIVGRHHADFLSGLDGSPALPGLRAAAERPGGCGRALNLRRPHSQPLPVQASGSRIELYGRSFILVLMHPGPARVATRAGLGVEDILAEVRGWPAETVANLASRLADLREGVAAHPPEGT
jgi:PAS domain S-box-containing protein